jgi:hypothetical protein
MATTFGNSISHHRAKILCAFDLLATSEKCQQLSHIVRQRRLNADGFVCSWVHKSQSPSVKGLSVERLKGVQQVISFEFASHLQCLCPTVVSFVARNRQSQMLQVNPNLVGATRYRFDFKQCETSEPLTNPNFRHSVNYVRGDGMAIRHS